MTTLIYCPGASVVIESANRGLIDVSDDVSSGALSLRENASHTLSLTLENPRAKYDGAFAPNDRVAVQLKRFRWMQVFTGYLDTVPYFSAFPTPVQLRATCTSKVLKNFPWDRGSSKAYELIHGRARDRTASDGGMAEIIVRLFKEVMGWPEERVHIGRIPTEWVDKFTAIYEQLTTDRTFIDSIMGTNPFIGGVTGAVGGPGNVAGPTAGVEVSDAYIEALQFGPADIPVMLATIRHMEGGGNYQAVHYGDGRGGKASGAYGYMTGTWNNYKGYRDAMDAPPAIQDERAASDVLGLLNKNGPKLIHVPASWYIGHVPRPEEWDKVPKPGEGNRLTVRAYAYKWARKYVELYLSMQPAGGTPLTQPGPVATPGIVVPRPTAPSLVTNGTMTPTGSNKWPIPIGMRALSYSEVGWGGHRNGHVPTTAMAYTRRTGSGHPEAIAAYTELLAAADAAGGIKDLKGSFYRSAANQAVVGSMGAPVGQSNHGWGLAIDIDCLVAGGGRGGAAFQSPEYAWLKANAYKWGFGHPYHAEPDGSKPEAWHWEFFAIYSIMGLEYTVREPTDNRRSGGGVSRPRRTATMTGGTGAGPEQMGGAAGAAPFGDQAGVMGGDVNSQIYAALAQWFPAYSTEHTEISEMLAGFKAPMNDEPMMETISKLTQVAGRNYCSAPNGDFIAWWPDYWGEFGTAGILNLETIELKDFTVEWSDAPLVTHQYVDGASTPGGFGAMPGGITDSYQSLRSMGMATVSMPGLLQAIINMPPSDGMNDWLRDPSLLLRRMGARISHISNDQVFGPQAEFWVAVQKFTRAWAAMFTADVPMTFMPELFPGMLLRIPDFKVQFYVSEVTHRWGSNDSGYETSASVMAPSALAGSGFFNLPKGGHVFQRSAQRP